MSGKEGILFKDPTLILGWLETALDKEKEKYAKCPIMPDRVPGHDAAKGGDTLWRVTP